MRNWRHKLKLKDIILEPEKTEFTVEELREKTIKFWKVLKLKHNMKFMEEFVEEFEGEFEPKDVATVQDFDELLGCLYDYCDYNSIWVE